MKKRFTLIGLNDEAAPHFSDEVSAVIAAASVFSGGRRHHELVRHLLPAGAVWIDIAVPLDAVFARYEPYDEIVVFASGDPWFFGFGATIRRRLPDAGLRIFPAMNSLQTLAHRVTMPYDDMTCVSLTGRPWQGLDCALIEGRAKIGVLTDREHTPAAIADRLLSYGYTGYRMVVGEHLGSCEAERIAEYSLEEAARRSFGMPNCVILHGTSRRAPLGIPDTAFEHLDGRAGMMTKMPIRLLTLSVLQLHAARCFWDIGSCTGSISIEARLRAPQVQVHAFEVRPEGERLLSANARRFGAPGIVFHGGDFFDADIAALPAPDAAFIGGHGGRLVEAVARLASIQPEGGRLVFNSVSDERSQLFMQAAETHGYAIGASVRMAVDAYNPITVIQAIKQS